jgi:DNA modification methylase
MKPYYADDWVTLYHGDCREVMPTLAPVDAVITDPPYGVSFAYDAHDDDPTAYADLLSTVQAEVFRLAPVVLVTPGIGNLWRWPEATWVICWHKPGAPRRSMLPQPNRPQGGFNEWEPVLVYGRPRFMHDVLRVPAIPQRDAAGHPCPKPVDLLRLLVAGATTADQTVLDPFAGSGTTLVAAKREGRRSVGIEMSEAYCEIAAKRLDQGVLDFGEGA